MFLSLGTFKNPLGHSLLCAVITFHGKYNPDVPALYCYLLGTSVLNIRTEHTLLANDSYQMLVNTTCCGMSPGIAYLLTVSRVSKCCRVTLFPHPNQVIESIPWPKVHIKAYALTNSANWLHYYIKNK